jgi:hypothetical protein
MFTARKTLQIQWAMLAAGVALAAFCLLVYLPLEERGEALDGPLRRARQRLVALNVENPFVGGLDPEHISDTLARMDKDLELLKRSERVILGRIELDAPTRGKLRAPFQLIDYQNERQLRIEELGALAKKQGVVLDAAAVAGFPDFVADRPEPGLLWAQLSLVQHLVHLAIQSKVSAVQSLAAPIPEPVRFAEGGGVFMEVIPIRLEVTGPADALSRFLRVIPLRNDEAKAFGLPDPLAAKPALFIDRIAYRKIASEKTDQGHVELHVRGYVYRD